MIKQCTPPGLTARPPPNPIRANRGSNGVSVVGKAASQHAAVAAQCLGAIDGLCIIPKGHKINTSLDVIEASHPIPDEGSLAAAEQAFELARSIGPSDRLVCLISRWFQP